MPRPFVATSLLSSADGSLWLGTPGGPLRLGPAVGDPWVDLAASWPGPPSVVSLAGVATDGLVAALGFGGVLWSEAGDSWIPWSESREDRWAGDVARDAAGRFLVADSHGFSRRAPGEDWAAVPATSGASLFGAVASDPADADRVLLVGGPAPMVMTSDGGATWEFPGAPFAGDTLDVVVSTSDPRFVYVSGVAGEFFASADRGETWTDPGSAGGFGPNRLAVHPGNPLEVWGAGPFGVFVTRDGGATADRVLGTGELPDGAHSVAFDPGGSTVFVGGSGTVLASGDGGQSWDELPGLPSGAVVLDLLVLDDVILAGTPFGIWRLERATAPGCVADATTLCLDGGRFRLSATWQTRQGAGGAGTAAVRALAEVGIRDGGIFSFFDPANPELLVKVLDGCSLNGHHWVFSAATTTVGFELVVEDLVAGSIRKIENADGHLASTVTDVVALPCGEDEREAPGPTAAASVPRAACGPATLCIDLDPGDRRFRVDVAWETAHGGGSSGLGRPTDLADLGVDQGGVFSFFSADNPEILVKVLDGCAINGRRWVFYAATTDVGFGLTVEDSATGETVTYVHADGSPASPVADTGALGGC